MDERNAATRVLLHQNKTSLLCHVEKLQEACEIWSYSSPIDIVPPNYRRRISVTIVETEWRSVARDASQYHGMIIICGEMYSGMAGSLLILLKMACGATQDVQVTKIHL
jgi:hypothetical protein